MASLRAFALQQWRHVLASARGRDVVTPTLIHGYGLSRTKGFSAIDHRWLHYGSNVKMDEGTDKDNHVGQVVPSSQKPFLPTWARWIFGAILPLLPFGKEKWEGLRRLEGQVENVAETVENVAEVVEKVAGVAEKVSGEVADNLPEDSTLKGAALLVEHVSKEAAKDAHFTINLIHKVDKLKQEVEEAIVEPIREPKKLLGEETGEK